MSKCDAAAKRSGEERLIRRTGERFGVRPEHERHEVAGIDLDAVSVGQQAASELAAFFCFSRINKSQGGFTMNQYLRNYGFAACLLVAAPIIAGCAGPNRTAGQTVDDATITAKVKSQLLASPEVSGLNVNVTTYDGQVQLSGYVNSAEQRRQAEQIAKSVEGVKSVSNDLIVKAPQQ